MTHYPAVSVVVSTYKRPALLKRALLSIAAQTFRDFELIIVHDGPFEPATTDVLDELIFHFHGINVTPLALSENSGYQCVPKNVGIHMSKGDYIAFLDDDNEWTTDHLAVLVHSIEEGEDWPDFVYGRREYINETAEKLPSGRSPYVEWNQHSRDQIARGPMHNFVDSSDLLIARGAFWRLELATGDMWKESLRRFADWELIVRGAFFSGWKGKGVDKVLQRYYWHGENIQLTRPYHETPQEKHI